MKKIFVALLILISSVFAVAFLGGASGCDLSDCGGSSCRGANCNTRSCERQISNCGSDCTSDCQRNCADNCEENCQAPDCGTPSCAPVPYVVTFDANGGEYANGKTRATVSLHTLAPWDDYIDAPTRQSYVFSGWYYDLNCTDKCDESRTISSALTVYAGWRAQ